MRKYSRQMGRGAIVGFGAVARLRELGIAVPEQVSVAGFDDVWFAADAAPALTTVRHPNEQLGRQSWRMLARLLADERGLESELLVPELVVRDSTGPAAAGESVEPGGGRPPTAVL